ncbi:MAG: GNAT family N-acetyltransferase [Bacteroidales bacterium]|jgi:RimJ/RimL family protein N-acetyltransferase
MKILFNDISLIPWSLKYAARLAEIANNKKIADNLRDGLPNPYSINDANNWLNSIIPVNDPPRFFAIFQGSILAGSIGLVTKEDIYRKNIEIGYFLAEEHWGQGIMTKAILAATTYVLDSFDIIRVYAEVFADNTGSRKALEKAGFFCEAVLKKNIIKNGIIKDSCIYSILRESFVPGGIIITP